MERLRPALMHLRSIMYRCCCGNADGPWLFMGLQQGLRADSGTYSTHLLWMSLKMCDMEMNLKL